MFFSHSKYETVTPPAFKYRSCKKAGEESVHQKLVQAIPINKRMKGLVRKGTVVPRWWRSETPKFGIKRVAKGQITTVRTKLTFERLFFVRAKRNCGLCVVYLGSGEA